MSHNTKMISEKTILIDLEDMTWLKFAKVTVFMQIILTIKKGLVYFDRKQLIENETFVIGFWGVPGIVKILNIYIMLSCTHLYKPQLIWSTEQEPSMYVQWRNGMIHETS